MLSEHRPRARSLGAEVRPLAACDGCYAGIRLVARNTFWEIEVDHTQPAKPFLLDHFRRKSVLEDDAASESTDVSYPSWRPLGTVTDLDGSDAGCSSKRQLDPMDMAETTTDFDISEVASKEDCSNLEAEFCGPPGRNMPAHPPGFLGQCWTSLLPTTAVAQSQTTVMLKNLPKDFTMSRLVDLLESQCCLQKCDFLYVPKHFETGSAFGYAFVNVIAGLDAEAVLQKLNGCPVPDSAKLISALWRDTHQGLNALIELYRNSSVMHSAVPPEHKPVLLREGKMVPFPAPTQALQAPRGHKSSSYGRCQK